MFTAIDNQHNLILAAEYADDRQCYCPGCLEEVVFRQGMVNQAHFAHKAHSLCQMFSEGETMAHVEGKFLLYDWFKKEDIEVELEAFLPELNQRPDLLVKHKGNIFAIEYQCSPISKKIIRSRTEGYVRHNMKVIWILGRKLQVDKSLTPRHYDYLTLNKHSAYSLFQLDEKKRQLEVITCIRSSTAVTSFSRTSVSFSNTISFVTKTFNHYCNNNKPVHKSRIKEEKKLYQLSFYKDDRARRFFELLYQNNLHIKRLPDVLFYTVSREWIIKTLSFQWKLLFVLWIEEFDHYQIITENCLNRKLEEWLIAEDICFYYLPDANLSVNSIPFLEYLDHLCQQGYLKEVGLRKWVRSAIIL